VFIEPLILQDVVGLSSNRLIEAVGFCIERFISAILY